MAANKPPQRPKVNTENGKRVTRLEAFFRQHGINRSKFNRAMSYTASYVKEVRLGKVTPPRERMAQFAEVCGQFVGRPVALTELFEPEAIYADFGLPIRCSISAVFVQAEGAAGVVAYVPEIAGVHGQGATIYEAKESLAESLESVLKANRQASRETFEGAKVLRWEIVRNAEPRRGRNGA